MIRFLYRQLVDIVLPNMRLHNIHFEDDCDPTTGLSVGYAEDSFGETWLAQCPAVISWRPCTDWEESQLADQSKAKHLEASYP